MEGKKKNGVRVGIYQGGGNDVAQNINKMEELIQLYGKGGAKEEEEVDLLAFCELYINGYGAGLEVIKSSAEEFPNGLLFQRLSSLCSEHKIGVLFGYAEKNNEKLFNSSSLIDKEGKFLLNYQKTHLWGKMENDFFEKGEKLIPPVLFEGIFISTLVCFDVEFPETVRTLSKLSTQLLLVPTALASDNAFNALITVPSRAFENQIFVGYINRVGKEISKTFDKEVNYCGLSTLVAPNGNELIRFDREEEGVKIAEIEVDKEEYSACRSVNPYLSSLRPSLYQ